MCLRLIICNKRQAGYRWPTSSFFILQISLVFCNFVVEMGMRYRNSFIARQGLFLILFMGSFTLGFSENASYINLLDSAENTVTDNPSEALKIVEQIPTPVENYLDESLGRYYYLKGQIYDRQEKRSKVYSSYTQALLNAEKYENYELAGDVCYSLAIYLYWMEENDKASFYLNKAKAYFTKIDDKEGLIEVQSVPAYIAYLDHNYIESNRLLRKDYESYKSIKSSTYYNLFIDFLLVSNYLHLHNLDSANYYYEDFKKVKENPITTDYDYNYYNGFISLCYVDYYYDMGDMDSCLYYLDKTMEKRSLLDYNSLYDVFLFYQEVYTALGDEEKTAAYVDSLLHLQQTLLDNNVAADLEAQEELLEYKSEHNELSKKFKLGWLVAISSLVLLIGSIALYLRNKRNLEKELKTNSLKQNEFSFIQANQNKLEIKLKGLEDYINNLKSEVNKIAYMEDVGLQKKKIQELYKELHLKVAESDGGGNTHLMLVNKLNTSFYVELKEKFPNLNESEIVICYYTFIGLKNKEIAVFLNATTRSVESKRLRITKKINLPTNESLVSYLTREFKHTLE